MRAILLLTLALGCRTSPDGTEPPAVETGDSGPEVMDPDSDGDGFGTSEDCDDGDPSVHPGAEESCNGIDDDCDEEIDEGVLLGWLPDADGDGWGDEGAPVQACEAPAEHVGGALAGDCDDGDAAVHPEAEESCDGVDQDCDGHVDEGVLLDWWADVDGDGWGNASYHSLACEAGVGMVDNDADCDDADAAVHPEAEESCNGIDDDCDGTSDEGCE